LTCGGAPFYNYRSVFDAQQLKISFSQLDYSTNNMPSLSSFSYFFPPPISIIIYFQGRKPHIKTPDRAAHGYCSPGKGEGGRGLNTGIRVGAIIQS
jgi:hypothetical protein